MLFLGIAVTVAFAIIFRWLPSDAWEAWMGFVSFFAVSFGIGLAAMIVKTKIEDSRYNKLLSDYKSKRETGRANDND